MCRISVKLGGVHVKNKRDPSNSLRRTLVQSKGNNKAAILGVTVGNPFFAPVVGAGIVVGIDVVGIEAGNSITKHALLEVTTSALVTSDTNSLVLMSSTILRLENLMQ